MADEHGTRYKPPCAILILTFSDPSKFQVAHCKARTWTWN